jgi:CRISPR-associated exonuclease Cas4
MNLTVTDACQYAYCPRTAYFTYVMPFPAPLLKGVGIKSGRISEESLGRLMASRPVAGYRLEGYRIHKHVTLRSERHGLSGRLELAIEVPERVYPAVIKEMFGPLRSHHRLFLACYSLLTAEAFGRPADTAFFHAGPDGRTWRVQSQEQDFARLWRILNNIRGTALTERMPSPTRDRRKCLDCERRRFCGDIT